MSNSEQHAVIVHVALPQLTKDDLFHQLDLLQTQLSAAIEAAKVGEFDGHGIREEELELFMYGPDAEKLFNVVAPILRATDLVRSGVAEIRTGPAGSRVRRVYLSASL